MHRINNPAMFLVVAVAGLIQSSAFNYISIFGIKPDLLLTVVIFFSLSCSRDISVKSALLSGAFKDITSMSVLGGHTVSFLLIALILNYHQNKFYRERVSTQVLLTLACSFSVSLLILLFNLIAQKGLIFSHLFLNIALKEMFYTGFIAPLTFFMLSKALNINLNPSL